jgi:excisionase family DNA binding protein
MTAVETTAPLLDVNEVARRLGTEPRFVRRLIAERRIEYHKLGRYVRISESALADYIKAGRVEPLTAAGIRLCAKGAALWRTRMGIDVSATSAGCLLAGIRFASPDRMAGYGPARRPMSVRATLTGLLFLSKPS